MPKLDKKTQKSVNKTDAATPSNPSFDLIPRGKYVAKLSAVTEDENDFGLRWVAEFTDIHDLKGKRYPGRQWLNLPMPEDPDDVPSDYEPRQVRGRKRSKAEAWAELQEYRSGLLKAFFEAMGYTEDTDTEEMVDDGATALISITQTTAKTGNRKGERFNRVNGVEAVPDGVSLEDLSANDDSSDGEDTW